MIRKLCYELYKLNWEYDHNITVKTKASLLKDYFANLVDKTSDYTFSDYIEEFGYDGDLYVCYEEFCDTEYHDKEYMCSLLDNEDLITMYYKDVDIDRRETPMDWEKLNKLKRLIDELIGENEPTDEELDFDDDAIEMYADLHNLKESMERIGL